MENAPLKPSSPAASLGLTLLLLGLTFGLPFALVPTQDTRAQFKNLSPDMMNVYACVAWAGWAHFLYAFRGQGLALMRATDPQATRRTFLFVLAVAVSLAALYGVREWLGPALFSGLVWLYFIDHFIKAERAFEGMPIHSPEAKDRWLVSYQPLLTFAWLSIVLLNYRNVTSIPWLFWGVSALLGTLVLLGGGWLRLRGGDPRGPLLSLFFVFEALVWGTISQRGGEVFMAGVYVFHIAAGSYMHYLGSYFMGHSKAKGADRWLHPLFILALNIAVILLGVLVAWHESMTWLRPILGVEWFTLWVGLHLVVSDLFPVIKGWRRQPATAGV